MNPPSTRVEQVRAHDGGSFSAHLTLPPAGQGPGVLLIHEISGVNDYIEHVAARLAELGYVVLAPDLFWRIDPDHPYPMDEKGLEAALERVARLDVPEAVRDADAALAHLSRLPEVVGGVAVLGFCLGGTIAFGVGLRSEPDAVVSYYGSGVPDLVADPERLASLDCPVLLHFGTEDPYIPMERVEQVRAALADRPGVELHLYEAGHAFDNPAPMFHNPEAAERAWGVTADFLRRVLAS